MSWWANYLYRRHVKKTATTFFRAPFHTSLFLNTNKQQGPSPNSVVSPDGQVISHPTEPAVGDCCGRGCEECVWTTYWKDVGDYNKIVAEITGIEPPLDPFEELERKLAQKQQQQDAINDTSDKPP
jgi:hypothetical protein